MARPETPGWGANRSDLPAMNAAPREREVAECDKCGQIAPGRRRWMFYRWLETFPDPPARREFMCNRCLRMSRLYAAIGFLLIFIVVAALFSTLWLL